MPGQALNIVTMTVTIHDNCVANDNDPANLAPRGDAVGFRAFLTDSQRAYYRRQAELLNDVSTTSRNGSALWVSILLWGGIICAAIWAYYSGQPIGVRLLASIALIWFGLWLSYLSQNHKRTRIGELAIISALAGFVAILMTAVTQLGLPLSLSGALFTFVTAALIVAWLNLSNIALIASIAGCFTWAALHLDGYIAPSVLMFFLPALWSGQLLLGAKMRSTMSLLAALMIAYGWLIGATLQAFQAGHISPLFLAGGTYLIGSMHMRVAKAMEDEGLSVMGTQVLIGWTIGTLGLLGVAKFALDPSTTVWTESSHTAPLLRLGWLMMMAFSVAIIFLSGLVRRRHAQMTLPAILIMTLIYMIVPTAIWFMEGLPALFTDLTDVQFFPLSGIILSGIILGSALVFSFNSMRRGRYIHTVVGLGSIALLSDLTTRQVYDGWETAGLLLLGSLLTIMSLVALSQAQLDQAQPKRRLQKLRVS